MQMKKKVRRKKLKREKAFVSLFVPRDKNMQKFQKLVSQVCTKEKKDTASIISKNTFFSWSLKIIFVSKMKRKSKKLLMRNLQITNISKARKWTHSVIDESPSRPQKIVRIEPKNGDKFEVMTEPKPAKQFILQTRTKIIGRLRKRMKPRDAVKHPGKLKREQH